MPEPAHQYRIGLEYRLYQEIIEQLKNEGYQINEDDLLRISPAPFEHTNRLGKYDFKNGISMEQNSLRALRKPKP